MFDLTTPVILKIIFLSGSHTEQTAEDYLINLEKFIL